MGVKLSMSKPRAASAGRAWAGTSLWLSDGAIDSSETSLAFPMVRHAQAPYRAWKSRTKLAAPSMRYSSDENQVGEC